MKVWMVAGGGLALMAGQLAAQNAPHVTSAPVSPFAASYPKRVTDPDAAARGKALYVANACSFCHGPDARGGNGGPSLLRSQKVLQDKKGEIIGDIILKGVTGTNMQAFKLQPDEIADIAEFLHSFDVAGYDNVRMQPAVFTMGNAGAGQKYFTTNCAACHSASGDLKGFASRFDQPRNLQQAWLMPKAKAGTQVTVIPAGGAGITGRLGRIDEFSVELILPDGSRRSFDRDGDVPKVEIADPLAPHLALLRRYRDADIHNVTAYLVTFK